MAAETPEQRAARLAVRNARMAADAAKRKAHMAERAAKLKPFEADVEAARDALLAFDRKAKRQALVDALRAAQERLAEARYPGRDWRTPGRAGLPASYRRRPA